jgi:hypothetical protein
MDLRWAALAGAALLVGPAAAAPFELNGVTVEAPNKWAPGKGDRASMLWQRSFDATDNDDAGAALIQLFVPRDDVGTLAQGLATLVGGIGEMKNEDPIIDQTGINASGHDMIVQFRCCGELEGLSADLSSIAVGSPERQAYLLMVMLNLGDERQDAAEAVFAEVVRSLRMAPGEKGFELVPQPGDGGLDGVYTFLRTGLMPNVFGGLDFTADSEVRLYTPDGYFTEQLPAEGVKLADHCANVPETCGTYRVSGGGWFGGPAQIEIRSVANEFGLIEVETSPFAKTNDSITINEEEHQRLPPFAPDTRLAGDWRYFFASSGMTATSSGSIAVERYLTLTQDGRFERSAWSGASSSNDTGGGTTGVTTSTDRPSTSGTYQLEGYTLTLTGNDGQSEKLSVFAPDIGSDELLVIDGSNYLKQD